MNRYYHGSPDLKWIDLIRSGQAVLKPGMKVYRDRWLQPLKGMVYLSPNIVAALFYAKAEQRRPWQGVVLEVVPPKGAEIVADEDCVGEAIGYAFGMSERSLSGWDAVKVMDDSSLLADIADKVEAHLPVDPSVFETDPELRVLVRIAKKVRKHLDASINQRLIAHGSNVAVKGQVRVTRGRLVNDDIFMKVVSDGDLSAFERAPLVERAP